MNRKLLFLVNPISGTKKKEILVETIKLHSAKANIPFEILPTSATGNYAYLKEIIQQDQFTDIIVCGGDGSVSAVTGSLLNTDLRFGIIPTGSGNGLALTAKIPLNTVKALEVIFAGKDGWVDGFFINKKFSCMLCGIGFDAEVAQQFATSGKRGLHTYIRISVNNYFKAKPYPFRLQSHQTRIDTEAYLISIANSNQFGNNFIIAPQASLTDGLLDIVVVKKMSKWMLPFSVISHVTGTGSMHNIEEYRDRQNIIYFQATKLTLENPKLAPLHIDGDPAETNKKFEIEICPRAYRLLQPFPLLAQPSG